MAVIYKKLGEIADISAGGTPKRSNPTYWKNGNIPWVKISDIKGKYLEKTEEFITEDGLNNSSAKLFKKGTLLYTIFATIGECAILNIDASTNQAIAGINVKSEKVLTEYLYYFLKSIKNTVVNTGRGVAQNNINLSILKNIDVPLPEIEVQKKIINLLNKSNELVIKRKAQIEALDQLTQSVFLEMFGDPITNPKGWKLAICKDVTTKIGSGATPKGGNACYKQQGISLIRSMNVYNNSFNYSDLAFIDEEQAEKLKNVIVNKDDILLNITGASVARSCIVPDDVLPARVNQHVSIIRVIKHLINPIFLSYMLTNESYQNYLLRLSTSGGATREAITKKQIENLPIIIPPLDLQEQFAIKVTKIEEQKSFIQKSIGEIENLFNSLMQKAFKGELFTEEKASNL